MLATKIKMLKKKIKKSGDEHLKGIKVGRHCAPLVDDLPDPSQVLQMLVAT